MRFAQAFTDCGLVSGSTDDWRLTIDDLFTIAESGDCAIRLMIEALTSDRFSE